MKNTMRILLAAGLLAVAGCSSERGATTDEYQTTYDNARSGPVPGGLVRPGMNPNDIRDPASITRPLEPRPNYPQVPGSNVPPQ